MLRMCVKREDRLGNVDNKKRQSFTLELNTVLVTGSSASATNETLRMFWASLVTG